ncbi:MAG: hypothetical protein JO108_07365 [Acidobacteriaceae bacterium]|nr:hypothetical protein [Acidobacteriaceae bacterium]
MFIMGDRRSCVPSDFQETVELLQLLAEQARNPVLRARLADLCWLLDRKKARLASLAISAYVEVVQAMERGELKEQFASGSPALNHTACGYLRRALHIGRSIGWDKDEVITARHLVAELRKQACIGNPAMPVAWFCDLDLDFSVSEPSDIAIDLNTLLTRQWGDTDIVHTLWRVTTRAYHLAKNEHEKLRSQSEAAELLVRRALAEPHAMLSAHHLSSAIASLHGIPGKKERRTELRHKLIDIQSRIPEELSVFTQALPVHDIAKKIGDAVERQENLLAAFFLLAGLEKSPDPDTLIANAKESIRKHPLSSIFGTSHHDSEGKVIHRSAGASFGDSNKSDAIRHQIAQAEKLRRTFAVGAMKEPARQTISQRYHLSDDSLILILRHSPFVPPDRLHTFCRGFARFFQGDYVSAVYILTPLLENSLRHVLKISGYDVSIFDDATLTQKDHTLSTLFEQKRTELNGVFGEALAEDIENVFLARPGPCLRHELAHGLLNDNGPYAPDAIYACWLLFRVCVNPLFSHYDELRKWWDA